MDINVKAVGVYVGEPKAFGEKPGLKSGFIKRPAVGAVQVTPVLLSGDAVEHERFHGGPDRVIHHYPVENFEYWRATYPEFAEGFNPGTFGENLSTFGIVESEVCIGDIFSLGSSKVQLTEGRKPCGFIDIRYGVPGMFREVQKQLRMGWFYRVLESGEFEVGSQLTLLERPFEFANLVEVSDLIMNGVENKELKNKLNTVSALSERWREKLKKLS